MSEKAPHSSEVGKDVVILSSSPDQARELQDRIEALLNSTDATDRDRFCVRLALEEALVNAIKQQQAIITTLTERITALEA